MKLRTLFAAILLSGFALAEEPKVIVEVDNFNLNTMHFAYFAAKQTPDGEPSAEQQIKLLNELVNTFILSNSAEGQALAQQPDLAAAIEVSRARLITQALIENTLENSPITDDEIKAVYNEQYAGKTKQEFKARHILVKTEDEAKALIKQLDGGADFAQLAKEHSTGPSSSAGGDLGWFEKDMMVKPFADAVASMSNGTHSGSPVNTQFGWHIILREDAKDLGAVELAQVKDDITSSLRTQKLRALINKLRENAKVEVKQP
ncbi:MAG: peptidylprolyl isomerase [Sedimenticolaceae bacterium]|jgi:peptidyl-prolyl cis-trans isomerase C